MLRTLISLHTAVYSLHEMPHSVTPPAEGDSPSTVANTAEDAPILETADAVEEHKPEIDDRPALDTDDAPMLDAPEAPDAPAKETKASGVKLEDLFAGMDSDDDEFPSSAPGVKKEISSSPDMPSSPG